MAKGQRAVNILQKEPRLSKIVRQVHFTTNTLKTKADNLASFEEVSTFLEKAQVAQNTKGK